MTKKEELLAQSNIVKECAKHLIKKIKQEKKWLVQEEKDCSIFGYFEDCGESYRSKVEERKARISALVEQKVSLEKFAKKLRHQAAELTS